MDYTACDKTRRAFENTREIKQPWAAGECFLHFSSVCSQMSGVFHNVIPGLDFFIYFMIYILHAQNFKTRVGFRPTRPRAGSYLYIITKSAVGYCAGEPKEKSRVFWIII